MTIQVFNLNCNSCFHNYQGPCSIKSSILHYHNLIVSLYSVSYNFGPFPFLNRYLPKTINWSLMMSLFTVSVALDWISLFMMFSFYFQSNWDYFQLSSSVIPLLFITCYYRALISGSKCIILGIC